jgi:hypothetical protein
MHWPMKVIQLAWPDRSSPGDGSCGGLILARAHFGSELDDLPLEGHVLVLGLRSSPATQRLSARVHITPWLRACNNRGALPSTAFCSRNRRATISALGAPTVFETRSAGS